MCALAATEKRLHRGSRASPHSPRRRCEDFVFANLHARSCCDGEATPSRLAREPALPAPEVRGPRDREPPCALLRDFFPAARASAAALCAWPCVRDAEGW